ncbi:quinon protein alcohol dehydrogenase-like superfamily [Suillus paluster]|uniref:quinon protein alcohol dehydrogenase-like superfamily n=1 Tax=Suillus paluster TaxID=48578 RepID=UPI001B877265|nr:quinon protein alcohol dehydrogenase-like superfamily [Suillus paluster]KAG1721081.1 quinon protein alcohol dehydrogenase-like superfamily [Suillus paluster]
MIATGGSYEDENLIKIWDAKTHKLIKILKGHTSAVGCLVWTADGKTIISGSFDSSIRTWNTTTWQQIAVLYGNSSINDISLSPNGRILATAPTDETAHLWNLENGQHISSLPQPNSQSHSFLAMDRVSFSADGKLLAAGCSDNNTYIWDISAILKEAGLENLLLDQNLQDKALPLNDDATRRPVKRHHDAHRVLPGFFDDPPGRSHPLLCMEAPFLAAFPLYSAAPIPTPAISLERSADQMGKRRNASAREKRRPIPLKPKNAAAGSSQPPKANVTQQPSGAAHPQSSLQSLATVSPSTTPVVAATSAATTSTTPPPHVTIKYAGRWTRFWLFICCASPEYTEGVIHLPGGERVITCSWDGSLRVWNLESGKQIGDDWRDGDIKVWTIALSPDGKKVVSGSFDGAMRLWVIDTGKVIARWIGHTNIVTSLCWSRDGRRVLSGSHEGTTREWDAESGKIILGPFETGYERVWVVVYSPDTSMIAIGGSCAKDGNTIKIWDAKTRTLVATLKGHTSMVECLVWTADGKSFMSGSADCSIRTWNTTTWQQTSVLNGSTSIRTIAISPNGRILASLPSDQTARLWNLDNGQPITDGKQLVTGGGDNNMYTWDISAIVKDAGLDNLLDPNPQGGDKALLDDDATRRPVPATPSFPIDRLQVFSTTLPDRSHFNPRSRSSRTAVHPRADLSSTPHGSTLLGRYFSLFRRTHSDTHDAPSRSRSLDWARDLFPQRRGNGERIELQEQPTMVDCSVCTGKTRTFLLLLGFNFSLISYRGTLPHERNWRPIPLKPKNAAAGSSPPPKASATQQSSGAAHLQPSSQQLATVASSSTPAVAATSVATMSTTSLPNATIRHAGRWTQFLALYLLYFS